MTENKGRLTASSKFLSLVLRHAPETIGLVLDASGWAGIDELLIRASAHGARLDRALLDEIVATSDKKRFAISDDGMRIRANQGHSVDIDLALQLQLPPTLLFHGTASRFLAAILEQGLLPQARQHVHMSTDETTAIAVGTRHGSPRVLIIQAKAMHDDGHRFYLSQNGVWLTEAVPKDYIELAA
ncbi:putative RNA 2'-phosphotransferase [Collimonas sp. PA-H2]|uniref:RNA 2'-phosphotransferase n=1 Tax=Collimonas sp. PA-H2 TaxID=1881062 RepID=UPI000BFA2F24|nr:RNA 2'-phosphotransferase [Collimonas sp. PA-H2]PFH04385.1 putative RNA 2'-phosphotransferase [Collimonas sp. PA-H2]